VPPTFGGTVPETPKTRDPALCFNDRLHIGSDFFDHAAGVLNRDFSERLRLKLNPPEPVSPAVRDHDRVLLRSTSQ